MLKPWWSPHMVRDCLLAEFPAAEQSWPAEAAWDEGGQCPPRPSADLAVFPLCGHSPVPHDSKPLRRLVLHCELLLMGLNVSCQVVCGCRLQNVLFMEFLLKCPAGGGVNHLFRSLAVTPGYSPCAVPCSSVALVPMVTNGTSSSALLFVHLFFCLHTWQPCCLLPISQAFAREYGGLLALCYDFCCL